MKTKKQLSEYCESTAFMYAVKNHTHDKLGKIKASRKNLKGPLTQLRSEETC